MKRKIFTLLFIHVLVLSLASKASAEDSYGKIGFKIEWGYSQNYFTHHRYNITSVEGYRIQEKSTEIDFSTNGRILLGAHYDYSRHLTFGLVTGYLGAQEGVRAIPLLGQIRIYPYDCHEDGFFTKIEGGLAAHISKTNGSRLLLTGAVGEGFHLMLSPEHSLDIILSISAFYDRPNIANPEGAGYIPKERILSNHALYSALNISICLSF